MSALQQIKVKNSQSQIVFGNYQQPIGGSSYKQQYADNTTSAQQNYKKLLQGNNNFTGMQKYANKPAQRGFMEVIGFKETQVEQEPIRKSRENTFVPQFVDLNATQRKMLDFYGIIVKPNPKNINDNQTIEPQKRSKSACRTASDIRQHQKAPMKAYENENPQDIYQYSMRSQVFDEQQKNQKIEAQEDQSQETDQRKTHTNEKNYSNLFGREFSKYNQEQYNQERQEVPQQKTKPKDTFKPNKKMEVQESAKEAYLRSIYCIPKGSKVLIQKQLKQENERPWEATQVESNPVQVYKIDVSNLPQNVEVAQLRKLMPKNVALVDVKSKSSNHINQKKESPAQITVRCATLNNNRAQEQVKQNLKEQGIEISPNLKNNDFEKIQPATTKWEEVDSSKHKSNDYEPEQQKFKFLSSDGEMFGNNKMVGRIPEQ